MENIELQNLLKKFPNDLEIALSVPNIPNVSDNKHNVLWYRKKLNVKEYKDNIVHQLVIDLR